MSPLRTRLIRRLNGAPTASETLTSALPSAPSLVVSQGAYRGGDPPVRPAPAGPATRACVRADRSAGRGHCSTERHTPRSPAGREVEAHRPKTIACTPRPCAPPRPARPGLEPTQPSHASREGLRRAPTPAIAAPSSRWRSQTLVFGRYAENLRGRNTARRRLPSRCE